MSQLLTNTCTTVGQIFRMGVCVTVALYHITVPVYRHTSLQQACLTKVSIHALSLCLRLFFWTHVFCALPSLSAPVALRDGSSVFSTGPSTLSRLFLFFFAGWFVPMFRAWFQGSLTRALIRDFTGSTGGDGFLETLGAPFLDVCTSWSTNLPTRHPVPAVPTYSPGSLCTRSRSPRRTEKPLAPPGQRGSSRDGDGRPLLCSSGQRSADASLRCRVVKGVGASCCCHPFRCPFNSPARARTSPRVPGASNANRRDVRRSTLAESRSDTPKVVPIRDCLEEIRRMMLGDFYVGRGCRQRNLGGELVTTLRHPVHGRERAISHFAQKPKGDAALRSRLWTLSGLRLVCHCKLSETCHADVFVRESRKLYATAFDREDSESEPASSEVPNYLARSRMEPERRGTGPPMCVGEGYVMREVCEGQSLASQGRWPVSRRRYLESELWNEILSLFMNFAGHHGTPQLFMELSLGKVKECPFDSAGIRALKQGTVEAMAKSGTTPRRTGRARTDTPIDYRCLDALLKAAADPEVSLVEFAVGVRLGREVRKPRLPALYAKKRKWRFPDRESRECGGPGLTVASLGAQRKEKPGGEVTARILFDGTHGIDVNTRIRIRDQERAPIAADVKRHLREKASLETPTFALAADISEAHRQVPIDPCDWHFLGCQITAGSDVYVHTFGTFGIASASYYCSRVSMAVGRIAQYLVGHKAQTWQLLVADDHHIDAGGQSYRQALVVFFVLCAVVGVSLSWHKTAGGDTVAWIGFELLHRSHTLGISERQATWFFWRPRHSLSALREPPIERLMLWPTGGEDRRQGSRVDHPPAGSCHGEEGRGGLSACEVQGRAP